MINKSLKYAFVAGMLAMTISAVHIKGLLDSEIRTNKTKATFILENQAEKIKNDFLFTMEQVYQFRALIYGAQGLELDPAPVINRILENPAVRNLLYAPNGIAEKVFPCEGNQAIIGVNLFDKTGKNNKEAIEALKTGKLILAGPYELKQGGKAFSGRLAIINKNHSLAKKINGFVSITVDFPNVIKKNTCRLLEKLNYEFTLFKQDRVTEEYIPIFTNETKPTNVVKTYFEISNIKLCLQGAPQTGWFDRSRLKIKIISLLFASIAVAIAIGLLINAKQNLVDKAMKDPLTGVFNRTGAMNMIERFQKISKYKHGAVAILDIDNFKSVNDILGHQAGDELLCNTSRILKKSLRDTDVISRLGGDEFMLYLPFDGEQISVKTKIEHIRKELRQTITLEDKSVTTTASIGVTCFEVGTKEIGELYKEADQALYISKDAGKNKVSFYNSAPTLKHQTYS